ncbi:AI-2E family transporter [candidate division KSB1 bacterium]|nr:AI-2E family transporter [candidate division KSB1 bacterium]
MHKNNLFISLRKPSILQNVAIALLAGVQLWICFFFLHRAPFLILFFSFTAVFYAHFLLKKWLALVFAIILFLLAISNPPCGAGYHPLCAFISGVFPTLQRNVLALIPAAMAGFMLVVFRQPLRKKFFAHIPNRYLEITDKLSSRLFNRFFLFYETQIFQSFFVFLVVLTGLWLIGVDSFWLLTWFAWFCSFIPFWGLFLGILPVLLHVGIHSNNIADLIGIVIIWTFAWLIRFLCFDEKLRSIIWGQTHIFSLPVLMLTGILVKQNEIILATILLYLFIGFAKSIQETIFRFRDTPSCLKNPGPTPDKP